jgi:hypothetical protein
LLHVFISRGLNAYVAFPPLDIPMHFFGGVAIAYFFAACLRAVPKDALPAPYRSLACATLLFTLTSTASSFWEFAEFFSDLLLGTHAQLGLGDTLLDMALGSAGGTAYLLWAWRSGSLGRTSGPSPTPTLQPSRPSA